MVKDFASTADHSKIPDEFLECIYSRRHLFPSRRQQHPQRVCMSFERTGETLDLVSFYGSCTLCTTTRTLYREESTDDFMWAEYAYPDGYLAPHGERWDRDLIRAEMRSRFPVKGKAKIIRR